MISLRTLLSAIIIANFLTLIVFIEISRNSDIPKTNSKPVIQYNQNEQNYPAGSLNPITEFGDKVIFSKRFNRPIKIKRTKPKHDKSPTKSQVDQNKTNTDIPTAPNNTNITNNGTLLNETIGNSTNINPAPQ